MQQKDFRPKSDVCRCLVSVRQIYSSPWLS